jgi:hypothetical protein
MYIKKVYFNSFKRYNFKGFALDYALSIALYKKQKVPKS